MTFKDHFSRQSVGYAQYRPRYPQALFEWLSALAPARQLAWDAGTGSGQAAILLADRFRRVVATDAAPAQIQNAVAHERITYKVMPAERTDLNDASVDLVTVAQALHWFDFERFYREVRRVVRRGGAIAAWAYGLHRVSSEIDPLLQEFYRDVVGPYWPPERRFIDECYETLPFPFTPVAPPPFHMEAQWTLDQLLGYLGTWSATERYTKAVGASPLDALRERLCPLWGDAASARRIVWPLYVRAGIVE